MDTSDGQSPKFSFCDDDGRAKVEEYVTTSKFRPLDQVYFCIPGTETLEGPFIVASVPEARKYTLIFTNGQPAKDGNVVEEKDLRVVESGHNTGRQ